jgi:hypothetical protein
VDSLDLDACAWRLFDSTLEDRFNLDYSMYFFLNNTENVDLFLITSKMPTFQNFEYMVDLDNTEVRNITLLQEDAGPDSSIDISWKDLPHFSVFLLARKRNLDLKTFKMTLKFTYEINNPMHPVGVFFLTIFLLGLFGTVFVGALYFLHTRHYIEVRIPKLLRYGWFVDYLSPEEKAAIKAEEDRL